MTSSTLRAIAALLSYPTEEMKASLGEILYVLRQEQNFSEKIKEEMAQACEKWQKEDLLNLQEEYVYLFDRTPSLSLHLFEHVHGDSKGRGQALVELDSLYRERGLENVSEHTPDYLPMFLEYLSMISPEEAQENLDGAIDVISIIGERLRNKKSPYAGLFDALVGISSRKPDRVKVEKALVLNRGEGPSIEEMDADWEEQFALAQISEGDGGGGCPMAEEMLARMGGLPEETEMRK